MFEIEEEGFVITFDEKELINFDNFYKIKMHKMKDYNPTKTEIQDFKDIISKIWEKLSKKEKNEFFRLNYRKLLLNNSRK